MECSICHEEVPFQKGHYNELDCIKYLKAIANQARDELESKEKTIENQNSRISELKNQLKIVGENNVKLEKEVDVLKKDLSRARELNAKQNRSNTEVSDGS